jgi:hypothetical protein
MGSVVAGGSASEYTRVVENNIVEGWRERGCKQRSFLLTEVRPRNSLLLFNDALTSLGIQRSLNLMVNVRVSNGKQQAAKDSPLLQPTIASFVVRLWSKVGLLG